MATEPNEILKKRIDTLRWNMKFERYGLTGILALCGLASAGTLTVSMMKDYNVIKNYVPVVGADKLAAAAEGLASYTGTAPAEALSEVEAAVKDSAARNPAYADEYAAVEASIDNLFSNGIADVKNELFYGHNFDTLAADIKAISDHQYDKEKAESSLSTYGLMDAGITVGYAGMILVTLAQARKKQKELDVLTAASRSGPRKE
jgi:hypothetical protein